MRIIEGDTGRWGTTGEVTRDFCLKPAGVCTLVYCFMKLSRPNHIN